MSRAAKQGEGRDFRIASTTYGGGEGPFRKAITDVASGLALWPLWARLGWYDILQRYRRSVLGPFWLTASMAVMVIALGVLYAELFKTPIDSFLPYLCVGLLVWNFISSFITEAGTLFSSAESHIKQVRLPYSVYVFRSAWSKLIIFAHNFLIYLGILLYFQLWPASVALLAVPGLLILLFNGVLTSLCLGMVSARFRDVPQLVNSLIQVVFFLTPIMWKPELLEGQNHVFELNPFFHLLEVVRAPLLGNLPSASNWWVVMVISIANAAVAITLFARFRARIAYWV